MRAAALGFFAPPVGAPSGVLAERAATFAFETAA
jgi:hypothetical protein